MARAPHLSFWMLVLSLIIFWMGCPSVGCEIMGEVLEACGSWRRVVGIVAVEVGNNIAALLEGFFDKFWGVFIFGLKILGVRMIFVLGFWI